jgi:glycosyltransferase involved in cell wall biosynthesis
LEALVVRIGLGSQVSFIYDASEELKWCALRHADLYIQPSHEEGFCLSFLDAAMVVPRLLGTATGEIPLIAGNDPDCAVVAPKDLRGLRDNVLRLLHITTTDSSLQARRLRLRDKYSWPSALAQLFSLYKELLRRPVDHTEDRSAWNTKELHLT